MISLALVFLLSGLSPLVFSTSGVYTEWELGMMMYPSELSTYDVVLNKTPGPEKEVISVSDIAPGKYTGYFYSRHRIGQGILWIAPEYGFSVVKNTLKIEDQDTTNNFGKPRVTYMNDRGGAKILINVGADLLYMPPSIYSATHIKSIALFAGGGLSEHSVYKEEYSSDTDARGTHSEVLKRWWYLIQAGVKLDFYDHFSIDGRVVYDTVDIGAYSNIISPVVSSVKFAFGISYAFASHRSSNYNSYDTYHETAQSVINNYDKSLKKSGYDNSNSEKSKIDVVDNIIWDQLDKDYRDNAASARDQK